MQSARIEAPRDLAPFIDHTLLRPEASSLEIERLCQEAVKYQFKAVCVNPVYVRQTRELLGPSGVLTASVIGFPLGASLTKCKALETELAILDGAAEIDMVIRIDLVLQERWREVEDDIRGVVKAAAGKIVKVILETGLLQDEKRISLACRASENAGAHFVKTATGFLGRGASVEDIVLMKKSCSGEMQIKASGGIKTFAQAKALIDAGATRLGTSSGVALVSGMAAGSAY